MGDAVAARACSVQWLGTLPSTLHGTGQAGAGAQPAPHRRAKLPLQREAEAFLVQPVCAGPTPAVEVDILEGGEDFGSLGEPGPAMCVGVCVCVCVSASTLPRGSGGARPSCLTCGT